MDLDVPAASATQITVLKIVLKMAHNGPNINFSLVLIWMVKTNMDEHWTPFWNACINGQKDETF